MDKSILDLSKLTLNKTCLEKRDKGQFYTSNYKYILKGLDLADNVKTIIEPFAGKCDLVKHLLSKFELELYDIDPKDDSIIKRDTLDNPPDYQGKFIITNPPYLGKNKTKNKTLFNKFKTDDLYKCFIKSLFNNKPDGGILILPLNFWCSIRKADIQLRKDFLERFNLIRMNIFEESVFNDTSYTVCSFSFSKRDDKPPAEFNTFIFPQEEQIIMKFNADNNYTFGGEIYNLKTNSNYTIVRATRNNITDFSITNIAIKTIDDGIDKKLGLFYQDDITPYIDTTKNLTARSYGALIISPELTIDEQKVLIKEFNDYINKQRKKYNSLFLTNYRESNTIARKRISFNLIYQIVNHLLSYSASQNKKEK